jgi:[acyl-carrier-protein] S-malonyltransferase
MAGTAFLFPGQGAQAAGMGQDFFGSSPAAAAVYEEAARVLGWDVAQTCFDGSQSELDRTSISQPAILATSWAVLAAIREAGAPLADDGAAAAGLSLGEYTALMFAGALEFADALKLVQRRGQFMEEACIENPGTMMSVIGLEDEIVEALCAQAREVGIVIAANYNSPGQVVISGERNAVDRVAETARQHGAKRVIPLAVGGAFHSPLMAPAAEKLEGELRDTPFRECRFPVVANVTAAPVTAPDEIRGLLARQVKSPVRWSQSIRRLVDDGFTRFVEVGPGKVLTGLMKRIAPECEAINLSTVESLRGLARS